MSKALDASIVRHDVSCDPANIWDTVDVAKAPVLRNSHIPLFLISSQKKLTARHITFDQIESRARFMLLTIPTHPDKWFQSSSRSPKAGADE
ncbi:hypothetical protein Slin15195_G043060 [Septoria linicola]|uniref:Uncharacterized protein n=1 Tax=Septoria linicola TaxID=215465 RepID=A0A9Q9EIF6_9PEZI|nr:hypothetical protein Slin14017_G046580 [Septoria linicola]USW50987.1 hypothetical protein Slin15195_G043060 [Septoria linicola]